MAVTAKMYGQFLKTVLSGTTVDLLNNPVKVMLCSSSYTPDQDNHVYKSDVTGEITGQGYTAGGQALTNVSLTYDPSTNITKFAANDVTWVNATFTARYAVLYVDVGATDAEKPLIGYIDFGADKSCENGDFTIRWDTEGIFKITTA